MGQLLWKPSLQRVKGSNMYRFMEYVSNRYSKELVDYDSLYRWSVENIPDFWAAMWDFAKVVASRGYDQVVDDLTKFPGATWFSGAKLNFAENLLRYRDDRIAIIARNETSSVRKITYSDLYKKVATLAKALSTSGVRSGDRVVGFMPNIPETVFAMLAATSLGATWSSCSPDFGIKGVLDRFGQIRPKILFTADGYLFKGSRFDCLGRIAEILKDLPSIEKVVVVPYTEENSPIQHVPKVVRLSDFISGCASEEMSFAQLPAGHPLYIMFTSGTTGLPKCMVQGAAGILVNQMKELMLHTDLTRDDTIFYFTTCGWMMWNWLVCSLSVGSTVVLFDGNPFHPAPEALWNMAEQEGITVFGISAGYIAALQNAGARPGKTCNLDKMKTILSTGSPLSVEGFEYIYKEVKEDVQLASISGGSDINGCFAGGNPFSPVYAGELQGRCLAMKVEAFDEKGASVLGRQGELVCTAAAPCMPIYFWDDAKGEKYHSAYFDVYPNVWRHGDFIEINDHGGVVIYGRSDATLNPGGVRIGTAEIYRQVEGMDEIEDSLVVGQEWKGDVRVILFVKPAPGHSLTEELKNKIKAMLRKNASPRHVPAKIIAVPDIPYTLNMKKVELAVKKVIQGQPVLNRDALRNPEVLDFYADLEELKH